MPLPAPPPPRRPAATPPTSGPLPPRGLPLAAPGGAGPGAAGATGAPIDTFIAGSQGPGDAHAAAGAVMLQPHATPAPATPERAAPARVPTPAPSGGATGPLPEVERALLQRMQRDHALADALALTDASSTFFVAAAAAAFGEGSPALGQALELKAQRAGVTDAKMVGALLECARSAAQPAQRQAILTAVAARPDLSREVRLMIADVAAELHAPGELDAARIVIQVLEAIPEAQRDAQVWGRLGVASAANYWGLARGRQCLERAKAQSGAQFPEEFRWVCFHLGMVGLDLTARPGLDPLFFPQARQSAIDNLSVAHQLGHPQAAAALALAQAATAPVSAPAVATAPRWQPIHPDRGSGAI